MMAAPAMPGRHSCASAVGGYKGETMRHFVTAMLACGIMLAALPPAHADTTCPPSPPLGSTVNGNLIVPPNQRCDLNGVTVTGNVRVQTNATLSLDLPVGSTINGNVSVGTGAIFFVISPSTINGNVVADQCRIVQMEVTGVTGAMVGGNVQIQNCMGDVVSGEMIGFEIGGNFACNGNSAGCIAVGDNIKGNAQINDNSGSSAVNNNRIAGNLQCEDNTTIIGGGNAVGGQRQGQCANF
jgi:hypothetical protein